MTKAVPIVERRPIAAGQAPRRFTARPDDRAELQAIIATMRDLPREAVESWPDLFNTMRRLSGRLEAIAGRLVEAPPVAPPRPPRRPATGLPSTPASPAAIAAGVFGQAARPPRQRSRTVVTRAGRRVRVVEHPGQMKLAL